eukprot:gene10955-3663_t
MKKIICMHGHAAKANPIFRLFERKKPNGKIFQPEKETLIVVTGPHIYISPNNYYFTQHDQVPTWNYTTVHCYVHPKIIKNQELKLKKMKKMVDYEEIKFEDHKIIINGTLKMQKRIISKK